MLHYHITPHSLDQHLWHVCLRCHHQQSTTVSFSLPNWVPGSYMIRDFARHIVTLSARHEDSGQTLDLQQTDKNTWQLQAPAGNCVIEYTVYAYDLSVRGAWLDRERGFFDGACVFLRHNQRQHEACTLHIDALPTHWQLATGLTPAVGDDSGRVFQATDYADLIDHPVEMGQLTRLTFEAGGLPHEIVISGHCPPYAAERLRTDVQQICTTQLAFFPSPPPFTHYVFLLHLSHNVYGGLEHRNSTALLADRHSLPPADIGENAPGSDYTSLLGLISHEYFHAWNVKSVKPQAFAESDLNQEAYSEQLWAFEGITSYYDDLFLVRSGVINTRAYLQLLAQNLTRVQQGGGRRVQTLAQASFNAWIKYYKPNENSPNALVSYYQQGALMALCLDAHIRRHSRQQHSLDTVMQTLYADYVRSGRPLAEGEWQARAQEITGLDLQAFFQAALYRTDALPLAEALADFGITLCWQPLTRSHGGGVSDDKPADEAAASAPATDLGARHNTAALGIALTHVFNGGSAETAGLCAGDHIIALDHLSCNDFAAAWGRLRVGQRVQVHYFRHGVLRHTQLQVQAAEAHTALLHIAAPETLAAWLQV